MGAGWGEGGEEEAFDGPVVGSVGWGEPLAEEGAFVVCDLGSVLVPVLVLGGEPECGGEGEVDFFEAAVGDVVDG